VNNFEALNLIR